METLRKWFRTVSPRSVVISNNGIEITDKPKTKPMMTLLFEEELATQIIHKLAIFKNINKELEFWKSKKNICSAELCRLCKALDKVLGVKK